MASHIIKFQNQSEISLFGSIEVIFPDSTNFSEPKFDLTASNIIAAFGPIITNPVIPNAHWGGISEVKVDTLKRSVRCYLDGTGIDDIPSGTTITLILALIKNPSISRLNASIKVKTWKANKVDSLDSGYTAPFHIDGPATSFVLSNVGTQAAGVPFQLQVIDAKDEYGHEAGGTIAITASSGGGAAPDGTLPSLNNITLRNGSGQASQVLFKAETAVTLQGASAAPVIRQTNTFNVLAGSSNRLAISGEPLTIAAETTFPNDITLRAFDKHGNPATGYAGNITFANDDPAYQAGDLPLAGVMAGDQKIYPKSSFKLRTAGARRIRATDGTLSDTTGVINVTGGSISNYAISLASAPVAGQPVTVTVSGAADAAGNPASGMVTLAFADGGAHSIGTYTPSLPIITVWNGSGSGTATFFKAEGPLALKGLSGGVERTSNEFTVQPGALGELIFIADPGTLTPLPESVTAGDSLGGALEYLLVTLRDGYGNVKTDFTGIVTFSSSDLQAVHPAAYAFTSGDQGSKKFARDQFKLKTAGNHTFTAQTGTFSKKLDPILVYSDVVTAFTLTTGTSQMAGTPFMVTVSNARDRFNNPASGLVEMLALVGGNVAPNGQRPTLTPISVNNGSGQAAQILVKTETVQLRGQVLEGGSVLASQDTPNITVTPGALGYLEFSGLPASVQSGATFPEAVTVTAYDAFRNLKTDYEGTIRFHSSAADATLPPDKKFDKFAQWSFLGYFNIRTPGLQTITVSDPATSPVVSTTSAPIDVSALLITSITTAPARISQGQTGILVQMELENIGSFEVINLSTGLHFGPGHDGDYTYTYTWPAGLPQIPANARRTVDFLVDAKNTALIGSTRITGFASGAYNGAPVSVADETRYDTWLVEQKAGLSLNSVTIAADTVNQGQSGILIECVVQNGTSPTRAGARITGATFSLRLNDSNDVSASFPVTAALTNDTLIAAAQSRTLRFYLQSALTAPIGRVHLYPVIRYRDANSGAIDSTLFSMNDSFFSQEAGALEITEITPSQPTVTREQTRAWTVTVGVRNSASVPLEVDFNTSKTYLEFRRAGTDYSGYFTILSPPTILANNSYVLAKSGATGDSSGIVYTIDAVNAPPGTYSIVSRVETTDGIRASDAFGSIEVQTEADLFISRIAPSQAYVTVNDASWPWYIDVSLTNQGGSTVEIDTVNSRLDFTTPGFLIGTPKLVQNRTILRGNQSDILRFPVLRSGNAPAVVTISATIYYTVLNSGLPLTSSSPVTGTVRLQNKAANFVQKIRLDPGLLTEDKLAPWRVVLTLASSATDGDLQINLDDGDSTFVRFLDYQLPLPARLAGNGTRVLKSGTTDSLIFTGIVPVDTSGLFPVTARVAALDLNSGRPASAVPPQTASLQVQNPPSLAAMTNSLQPAYVSGGTVYQFQINVVNNGGSTLLLDPAQTVFSIVDSTTGLALYSSLLDASFGSSLPGSMSTRTLYFHFKDLPAGIAPGRYPTRLVLSGTENRNVFSQTLELTNNRVTVASPREVMITSLRSESATVTTGQSQPWYIALEVTNNGSSILHLDQSSIAFYRNSVEVSSSFAVVVPDTFTTGSAEIPGNSARVIRYRVDAVDAELEPGQIIITGHIWLTDVAQAYRRFDEQTDQGNSGYVTLQSPAEPLLVSFAPSQTSVTRGQQEPWTISARVLNRGGSLLAFDPAGVELHFSAGDSHFVFQQPRHFLGSGDTLLLPGAEDTLRWIVDGVSAAASLSGLVRVDGTIPLTEINSGRLSLLQTSVSNAGFDIAVQDSAVARLAGFRVVVPQDSLVNAGQSFYVQACVKSLASRDGLQSVRLRFAADGYLSFPESNETVLGPIPAGDSLWTTPGILVKADTAAGIDPTLFARILSATAANTGQPTLIQPARTEGDSSKTIHIQKPGALAVTRIFTSQDTIPSGYSLDWAIQVDVTNPYEGILLLDPPKAADISIKQGFVIRAPELTPADRMLSPGDTLRVVYEVIASSSGSGRLPITARLTARDVNDTLRVVSTSAATSIFVSTSARVRIVRTAVNADSNFVDGEGIGHINTRQTFYVDVDIENSGGQPLRTIYVRLSGVQSSIAAPLQFIENLSAFEGPRRLRFTIQADSVENLAGELFTAEITQAAGEDGSTAFIAPATDAQATIRIYHPAVLRLISTSALTPNSEKIVSYGQAFPVEVVVQNLGSEPVSGVTLTMRADPAERAGVAATPLLLAKTLAAGDTGKVVFTATAASQSGEVLLISDVIASAGQNTRLSVPLQRSGQDSSTLVTIESGAQLSILSVRVDPAAVSAGDAQNDTRLYVKVANTGAADLRFLDISPDNVRFITNGIWDEEYRVNAPAKLMGSDSLVLRGQSQDSLLYIVTRIGDIAGDAQVRVQLKAMDLNKSISAANQISATGSTSLEVTSTSWVRINQTLVSSASAYDDQNVPLVNRGRQFILAVEAETSELSGVDSVWVRLTTEGNSSIVQPLLVIPTINKGGTGRAEFTVISDDSWDAALGEMRETFSAQILSAKAVGSSLAAQVRQPVRTVDALATVRIQNPARIDLRLTRAAGQDSILTASQEFRMVVTLVNLGSAAMRDGQYTLTLPPGNKYRLAEGDSERSFDVPLGQTSYIDTLLLIAPEQDSFNDTIRVEITRVPQDVNLGAAAATATVQAAAIVTTLRSGLALNLSIYTPTGAQDRILSTAQQMVLRATVQSTDNIKNKSVTLKLPVSPNYVLLSPAMQTVASSRDTVFWRIQVPDAETLLAHNFEAEARGQSADTVLMQTRSVTIDQIVSRASLWVDDLEVSSPAEGIMESGQANFSVRQQAILRTRVRNLGAARVGTTGRITLSLQNSGLTLVATDSIRSFTIGSYVTWNVQASDVPISEIRDIRVEITTIPYDENTNAPASIANGSATLNVLTEERGTTRINQFFISAPFGAQDNSVSTEQSFVVTADISSNSVRNLQAEISYPGGFTTTTPVLPIPSGDRQVVTWTMKAPEEAGSSTLTLTVSGKDLRSGIALTNQVRAINVVTQPATRFTLTPRIIFPKGLNNKVSSESSLQLALYIDHQGETAPHGGEAATIRLNVPASFLDGSEPLIKSGMDSLVWNLVAPAVRQDTLFDVNFSVTALPRDANSGLEASTEFANVYFPIWVVRKARLEVLAQVHDQMGSTPVPVRIGNEFDLVSILHNLGSADYYGAYQVQLRLPAGYSSADALTISTESDTVIWRVKAPDGVSETPDTLVVKLLSAPRDYFSKTEADIAQDSAVVLISPEAGFMVAKSFPVRTGSVGLRGGTSLPMLGLSLQNRDQSIGSRSLLDTIKVAFRSKRGSAVPARSVVTRIAAVRHGNPTEVLAENSRPGTGSEMVLNFDKAVPDTIRGSDLFAIDILIDIAPEASLTDFVVAVDSASAIVARDAIYHNRLSIADSTLNRVQYLGFSSGTLVVMQNDLEESFCNYPNPFGTASRPTTRFVYYLKQASDVRIKIFTLTGDLVQAWEYTKAAHPRQTSAGVHQDEVIWDGRNGQGQKVMNGVYLAYLQTDYGEMALTKIAVVK